MTKKDEDRLLGAHVSTAGGIDLAMERGAKIGANVVQIFSGSPRFWARAELTKIDSDKISSEQQKNKIKQIFIHSLYLINLTPEKPELLQKSIKALKYDLTFASHIKANGVVVHLGSHLGKGWAAVRDDLVKRIQEILSDTPADAIFLIENSAGQKGKLCTDLSQIRWLLDEVNSQRLGWCLDTCHAFAAGYDLAKKPLSAKNQQQAFLAQPANYNDKTVMSGYLGDEIRRLNLWESLKMIHVNDSKFDFATGKDQHANLGDGKIPPADLKDFLSQTPVKDKPLILEVPGLGGKEKGPDAENMRRLKALV